MIECIGCQKVNSEDLIFETNYWNVILSEDQHNIGISIISCKRHVPYMSELTSEELLDFHEIVKILESALKKSFDATMFNWSCLVNDAYKNTPPNPHVHWHFKPRYNRPVEFCGMTFIDTNFAHMGVKAERMKVNFEIRTAIIQEIKKHI